MSLLSPYLYNDFGFGIDPHNSWLGLCGQSKSWPQHQRAYLRPCQKQVAIANGVEKQSHFGKDGFQVCLDVQHFLPNEVSVKTIKNTIMTTAAHEEIEDDHGYVSRQFTRRYSLPDGFSAHDVVSTISSDGILTIKAPPTTLPIDGHFRHVHILHTGPALLSIGHNKPTGEESKLEADKNGK